MILTADDFGLSDGVNRAILDLCARGKLSAVGIMTIFPHSDAWVTQLRPYKTTVDFGLHVTLCNAIAVEPGELVRSAYLSKGLPAYRSFAANLAMGRISDDVLRTELEAQYRRFQELYGAPAYIDGHMYVHQIPQVAEIITRFVEGLPDKNSVYFRNTRYFHLGKAKGWTMSEDRVKGWILHIIGAWYRRKLISRGLRTNGICMPLSSLMNQATQGPPDRSCSTRECGNSIVVCHPAFVDQGLRKRERRPDYRLNEYRMLSVLAGVDVERFH